MQLPKSNYVYFAAICYSFIIGLSFLFVKLTLTVTEPVHVLAHRFTISFLIASIPIMMGWFKLQITLKDLLRLLPLSMFYPTLFFIFQTFGLSYTSSSEAGIIQATVPVFTALFAAFFLKEASTRIQKLSLLLSVSGVIFIFIMDGSDFHSAGFAGNLLILLSALAFAGYAVLARKYTKEYSVLDLTYIMTVISFVCFNMMSFLTHTIDGTLISHFEPFFSPIFVISILYLGGLSSLVSSLLSNYTLSKLEASKMSVFTNLSTLITILAGVMFLEETLHYYHIIGAILIILGIVGTNFPKKTP